MKIGPKRGDYITKRCDTLNNDQVISKDIELLRSNIKTKVSSPHFESVTDVIYKSKEKLFKNVKQRQVRKFNFHSSSIVIVQCVTPFGYIISPLWANLHHS